jgi:hypothetical protein
MYSMRVEGRSVILYYFVLLAETRLGYTYTFELPNKSTEVYSESVPEAYRTVVILSAVTQGTICTRITDYVRL